VRRVILAAIFARPVQDDIVRRHDVAAPVGDAIDRRLEGGILERFDLAAVVANEVVVMVAAGVGGLVASDAVTELDALHEAEGVHPFERAVHACDPDPRSSRPRPLVQLVRREAAVLLAQELDHDLPGAAAPAARLS
jgi:hypothetical protein